MRAQILSCVTISLLALQSYAQDHSHGFYFKFDAGPSWNEDVTVHEFLGLTDVGKFEFDTGVRFDGAIGYQWNPWLGTEFETGFIYNEFQHVNDASLWGIPLMVNLVLTVPIPNSRVVPYAGAGIGGVVSALDFNDTFISTPQGGIFVDGYEDDTVFGWQGFAGLKFILNEQFDINLSYKYLYTDSPSFNAHPDFFGGTFQGINFGHIHNHSAVLSATWRF